MRRRTKREIIVCRLSKEIRISSKGRIPRAKRKILAEYIVRRMDFNNYYQMHKSLSGYADLIVDIYDSGGYRKLF